VNIYANVYKFRIRNIFSVSFDRTVHALEEDKSTSTSTTTC